MSYYFEICIAESKCLLTVHCQLSLWSFNAHHVHFHSLSLSPIAANGWPILYASLKAFFLQHLAAISASSTALQERFHLLEQKVNKIKLFIYRIKVVETVTFFDRCSCIKVDWLTSDCYSVIAYFQMPKDKSFVIVLFLLKYLSNTMI